MILPKLHIAHNTHSMTTPWVYALHIAVCEFMLKLILYTKRFGLIRDLMSITFIYYSFIIIRIIYIDFWCRSSRKTYRSCCWYIRKNMAWKVSHSAQTFTFSSRCLLQQFNLLSVRPNFLYRLLINRRKCKRWAHHPAKGHDEMLSIGSNKYHRVFLESSSTRKGERFWSSSVSFQLSCWHS